MSAATKSSYDHPVINPHMAEPPVTAGARLGEAEAAALVLHGRGQTPAFMLEIVDRLQLPELSYLLPSAAGDSWYPGRFMEPIEVNQPWLDHALEVCDVMLRRIAEAGVPPQRTFFLGFSQGACVISEYLVRNPRRYAGAAVLTGGYVGPEPRTPRGSFAGMPVFLGVSRYDDWVPLSRAEQTAELFGAMRAEVTFRVYDDLEHVINDAEIAETRTLLTASLATNPHPSR